MEFFDRKKYGFDNFRIGFPEYKKSRFKNKIEIVTDNYGKILGLTNSDSAEFLNIPSVSEGVQIVEVDDGAFSFMKKLKRVTFSNNIESVGDGVFKGDENLEEVVFPESTFLFGKGVFENCGIKRFCFPSSVKKIPSRFFLDCSRLEYVRMGEVIKIDSLAFSSCLSLSFLDIGHSVEEISNGAFMNSGIKIITLPLYLKRIGEMAFCGCRSLKSIYYDGSREDFRRISFGLDWNRGINNECVLYLKENGKWVNAFDPKVKEGEINPKKEKALSILELKEMPRSREELSKAFKKIALRFHPDVVIKANLSGEFLSFAEEKFCEAKNAYDYLLSIL